MSSLGLSNLEKYYDIVYDQAISPSGSSLAACDTYGQIVIFNFSTALNSVSGKNDCVAARVVQGHEGAIYCLEEADKLLISGGDSGLKVWKWEHLLNLSKEVKCLAAFQPSTLKHHTIEINGMAYDSQSETVYCGCGDNLVYAWDLETSKVKATFSGHTNYIHCVCMRNGSSHFLSGSEDGTVKIWDPSISKKGAVQTLKPGKPNTSQWVGSVAVDDSGDWVVCGGSMGPTFYHLSSPTSATNTAAMDTPPNATTQAIIFLEDRIVSGGAGGEVRHWTINGEKLPSVPGSLGHIFSLSYNSKNKKNEVLTVSGDSSNIEVFTNLGYTAFSLCVPPPSANMTAPSH